MIENFHGSQFSKTDRRHQVKDSRSPMNAIEGKYKKITSKQQQ